MKTLDLNEIKEIISKVGYLNWKFHADVMGDGFYVQVRFDAFDVEIGKVAEQHGRKWYVSRYSTKDELVRTCFMAVMIASEHEVRENFLYNKRNVFGPHISVESLEEVSEEIVLRDNKMKVAIFGGSFNPIHKGHLVIAEEILKNKIADQVWFVPCGNHAFGKNLAKGEDRMRMIDLAIKNNKNMKVIGVEINPDKKSYTSETIKWFKKEFSHEFKFIIGADNLKDIERWHNYEYLRDNVEFLVVKRPGYEISAPAGLKISNVLELDENASSTKIRESLNSGKKIDDLVIPEVKEYITRGGIYNESKI